jgi:hypothetical protein
VWLSAWLARRSRVVHLVNVPRYLERSPRLFVIACCAGAIFLPPMIGNFGLGLKSGGPIGVMPYSDGLAFQRADVGEVTAVEQICQALPANASVLIADYSLNQQWAEDIRGTCNVPVAGVEWVKPSANTVPGTNIAGATVLADVRAVERAGRRPVVLGPNAAWMSRLGKGTVRQVMTLDTSIDEHVIFGTPRNTLPQTFTVYSWEPAK